MKSIQLNKVIYLRVASDPTSKIVADWAMCPIVKQKNDARLFVDIQARKVTLSNLIASIGEKQHDIVAFYGHGDINTGFWLDHENIPFIDCNTIKYLRNCLIYSVSCTTGCMGEKTVFDNSILAFIGYKGPLDIITIEPRYAEIFKKCVNSGINFLIENKVATLEDIHKQMLDTYNREIYNLIENDLHGEHLLSAAILLDRDLSRLVVYGDKKKKYSLKDILVN